MSASDALSMLAKITQNTVTHAEVGLKAGLQLAEAATARPPRLQGALEAIDEARLGNYSSAVPDEWNGSMVTAERIKDYLLEGQRNFDQLKLQLQAML